MGSRILSFLCIMLLIGCQAATFKEDLSDGSIGAFSFESDSYHNGKKVNGIGALALPANSIGKAPLVILVHGTAGIGFRENSWSNYLLGQGYATFLLDYFKPRGTDGSGRNVPRPPQDVWGALNVLATHPALDMDRVAVMGFSNGGSVAASSAMINPARDTNGILPKSYIMVYGGCHTPISNQGEYKPRLLYIVGSEDTLVPAETCVARGEFDDENSVDVMVIDGAAHMFDGNKNRTFTHPKWGVVTLRSSSSATELARAKVNSFLKDALK